VTHKLDERDLAVLAWLGREGADVESLAERTPYDPEFLRDRLPDLVDNGLVQRVDDVYRTTANGKRAIAGSPAGTMDDRIDTPPAVERRIESFDLRADREESLRKAFAFLRYWGAATGGEIIDGVYSENGAGFESYEDWWTGFVRDRLSALPSVEPPPSIGREWRYAGTPTVEEITSDGRLTVGRAASQSSVKYALEYGSLPDAERSAVRAAFDVLVQEGELTAPEIKDRVYADYDAGYDSAATWWDDCVRDAFSSLPGVELVADAPETWQYRPGGGEQTPKVPESDLPEGLFGSSDERDG